MYDELRQPKTVDELASLIHDQQTAIEVYAAALLAIDETRPGGSAYLAKLAGRLGLPPALVDSVHEQSASSIGSAA